MMMRAAPNADLAGVRASASGSFPRVTTYPHRVDSRLRQPTRAGEHTSGVLMTLQGEIAELMAASRNRDALVHTHIVRRALILFGVIGGIVPPLAIVTVVGGDELCAFADALASTIKCRLFPSH